MLGKLKKSSKIQSFTHLAITMMKLRKYHSHEFLRLSKLYNAIIQKVMSYKIEQEFLFELSLISLKTIDTSFSKRTFKIMSHFKIYASIICVDLVTPKSLWLTKALLCTWPAKPCIDFLQCMIRLLTLRRPLGYVSALGATRLVHWLILVAPSCLRSHNARYIMIKYLNIHRNISR